MTAHGTGFELAEGSTVITSDHMRVVTDLLNRLYQSHGQMDLQTWAYLHPAIRRVRALFGGGEERPCILAPYCGAPAWPGSDADPLGPPA